MTEDRCRPHGIPFDRDELPLDDEDIEDIAWIQGQFDSAIAAVRSHVFEMRAVVGTGSEAWKVHAEGNVMHDGSSRSMCGKPFMQLDTYYELFSRVPVEYRCQRCDKMKLVLT